MLELDFSQQLGESVLSVQANLAGRGITAVFGVSGAGKTSLINAIGGLTVPQQGRIVLNGRVLSDTARGIWLPAQKRRVGYVFQDARLFPHYRVRGNLQYGMAKCMRPQFESLIQLLGIESLLSRFPWTLSGGEKQRVAIGRALLTAPEIMLMDEPLASLDVPRKRELLPYLQKLARQVEIPLLYVSHSLDEVLQLADNVLLLDSGSVKAHGPLENVWSSRAMHPWLPRCEQGSVLQVPVIAQHPHYEMTALALGEQRLWVGRLDVPLYTVIRIRIQAVDVSLALTPPVDSSIRNIIPAQVVELLDIERQVDVKLQVGQSELWSRITPWARDALKLKAGMRLYAQIKRVAITSGQEGYVYSAIETENNAE